MAIEVSDRAVAEIKKAAAQRDDAPQGAARRHPRRRLHGLLLPVRVVGRRAAPGGQGLSFEDGAVRVFVDPKSYLYLDGSTLEYSTSHGGARLQVREPERQGLVRLRRERPVLGSAASPPGKVNMICWSCEKEGGKGPFCASRARRSCRRTPADDQFAVLGVDRASSTSTSRGWRRRYKELSRQLHPDRFAKADPRARKAALARTVELNEAWRS